jgi:hypothetical protein
MRNLKHSFARLINYKGRHWTRVNLVEQFPCFAPNSAGSYQATSQLTINTINNSFPALARLAESIKGKGEQAVSSAQFAEQRSAQANADRLKTLFNKHGSDKSTWHSYHWIYGAILCEPGSATKILEIGLGTNNEDVVSNMSAEGRPGASLRAFQEFCPNAEIYGADIDKRILFKEGRIKTFYIDQTDPSTFSQLSQNTGSEFDLIIDDGLHSPDANLNSLHHGLINIKKGGWVVVEDISHHARPIWETVGHLLPRDGFSCHLIDDSGALVFAVQKL